jgi:hypothetical protein
MAVDVPTGILIRIFKAIWNYLVAWYHLPLTLKNIEERLQGATQTKRRPCDSCGKPMKIAKIEPIGPHWEWAFYQCEDTNCVRNKSLKRVKQQNL